MSKFNWDTSGIPETIHVDNVGEFQSHAQKLTLLECAVTVRSAQRGCIERYFAELVRAAANPPDLTNSLTF